MRAKIVHSLSIELLAQSDFTLEELGLCVNLVSASALVLTLNDALTERVMEFVQCWNTPLFIVLLTSEAEPSSPLIRQRAVILRDLVSPLTIKKIHAAAKNFNLASHPPFTRTIAEFVSRKRPTFACPGHQGGKCLDLHPAGTRLKELLGEQIFQVDVPHAAPELGDVLCHEGPVRDAERLAADVFNSDETYFVLNGTSTANKIVTSALLTAGDLVLMDRNNHKSIFLGALIQSGALPVYLENFRDDCGVLGGYKNGSLDEGLLRFKASQTSVAKSGQERPFRLAIVQHATCDGVIVDAGALVKKIGHLCDYILFDSAWSGYEPFVAQLAHLSPLNVPVSEESPGLIVTQSVHKQMSGFSQTSQIHKKDKHIEHKSQYCSKHVFNNAFMLHSSTSPFYPLFMSLEVNAAVHAGGYGELLWNSAASTAFEFRSLVSRRCRYISPYYGSREYVSPNHEHFFTSTDSLPYFPVKPGEASTTLIEPELHYLDPCKVIFVTKQSVTSGEAALNIPASIVTAYLRENNFTPEKSDFYNFTLLISPSSKIFDLARLVDCLTRLESLITNDVAALEALPSLAKTPSNYEGISLKELCNSINSLYTSCEIERLQSVIFSSVCALDAVFTPFDANQKFVRGDNILIKISEAEGMIAAEGVIPYPPGIMCIAPGERWSHALVAYLVAIETLANNYPAFSPHIQGVHEVRNQDGSLSFSVLVLQ
ncbi:ornithine decarboxylase [Pseudomonas sp. LS1212]|uniref:Orn/Lys/Arg family decarboxylase n=1 Tax=Pseudomonas sp. LS1212 TaxID=2972478 RepID=UPI00215BE9D9|nr:ornithine decarboxylase [Pseudomonas sp. LS1212]UVJ45235.1 ornithine decarboxylase [Pseudomonas sp. LS1212]